jgi:3-oxoacyl-[acyl-carrier protein] reductase
MDARGKRVIVTGGVKGLGRAMVDRLIDKGAAVTVFDLDVAGLDALKTEQPQVHGVECDLANSDQVEAKVDEHFEALGATDVLINNAGILVSAPLVSITSNGIEKHRADLWQRVLSSDLSSVFYMTSSVVAGMIRTRTRGLVINISSVSATGNPGQSAYSAAKAGVNALTVVWARELSPMGIRVAGVAPGFTETESTKAAISEAVLRETVKRVPLRRLGQPAEIADGVMWVIANDFFAGRILELDGGLRI